MPAVCSSKEFLLLHILNFPALAKRVLQADLRGIHLFNEITDPDLSLFWLRYKVCANTLNSLTVSKKMQFNEYVNTFRVTAPAMLPEYRKRGTSFLQLFAQTPRASLVEAEGAAYLKGELETAINRKVLAMLQNSPTVQNTAIAVRSMDKLASEILTDPLTDVSAGLQTPLMNINKYLGRIERIPFGVDYLDEASYGGIPAGAAAVIIGPTGGGKTMMTIQMARSQAFIGNVVLWLTYEQPIEGDVGERLVSSITKKELGALRSKSYDELDPAVQDRLVSAAKLFGENLVVRDFSSPLKGADGNELPDKDQRIGTGEDIVELIELMVSQGRKPKMIFLDWLGEMVSAICAEHNRDIEKDFRNIAPVELKIVRMCCRKHGIPLVVFHQLRADLCKAPPIRIPHPSEALYWGGLPNNMDISFAFGTHRTGGSNVSWFNAGKNRMGSPRLQKIRLFGDYVEFRKADEWLEAPNGDFYNPDEDVPPDPDEQEAPKSVEVQNVQDAYRGF